MFFRRPLIEPVPITEEAAMLHLVNPEPGERKEKNNAFKEIYELPWWHKWLEIAVYLAALLAILEFAFRCLSWLLSS